MNLILASASPRRRELIKKLDYLSVTVCPSNVEEIITKNTPCEIVMELAEQKASSIISNELTLGADTMVFLDDLKLGKPTTEADARRMFHALCGRTHEVITGICLKKRDKTISAYERSFVTFNDYNDEIINNYIKTGKPFDKAGGYGAQDEEFSPILKNITGDYDNVLGLPVQLIDRLIRENFS
ncbi:MAG: septum formation protein Maf [Clostridia bacterium]|nr:septum formation protein Maf [Clostridia bacterium]